MQLSLRLNDDFKSMDYMNLFNINNIMKKNPIISSMSLIPKTSINDNFTIFISLLKNKVYQVYKKNIALSTILNNIQERLKTGDYISSIGIDYDTLKYLFLQSQLETINWSTQFVKELPGFDKFDRRDLSSLINSSSAFFLSLQVTNFYKKDESFIILSNIQFSKDNIKFLFGDFSEVIQKFHNDFNRLKLTENEFCLFFPFVLSSCNGNLTLK